MFETFHPTFEEKIQIKGMWHEEGDDLRFESIVQDQEGNVTSILFPVFDPDSDEYDNYDYTKQNNE
tara:strand:+ start:1159 stop:1356 length:198 start_codon:yes stop_codon:yes gene_type:complete